MKIKHVVPKLKKKFGTQKIIFKNFEIKKLLNNVVNENRYYKKTKKIFNEIKIQNIQDNIERLFKSDTNKIVLKQSKYWARAITWVLLGGTAFSIGWLAFAKTEEIAIVMGNLEPIGGVVDVQMPLQGIAREILTEEGSRVKKGDVLIRLDTEITKARLDYLLENLKSKNLILNKLKQLLDEGAVSELQYLEQKISVEELMSEIKANQVQFKYQEIKAPISGTVFDLKPKSPGFVAQTSEPVLKIVPANNLIAKVEIDSRSIGYIKIGKAADISIDTFPSTDFGVIKGTVTSIGSDALPPDPSQGKGYRFPAKIKLDEQFLKVKTGKKLAIQAGMGLTANIKLRKLTYLQLLLSNFSDKAESLNAI
nr:HlyD family efflux transporter periplasmic adaptor subunit [Prochlorococcus marinus]